MSNTINEKPSRIFMKKYINDNLHLKLSGKNVTVEFVDPYRLKCLNEKRFKEFSRIVAIKTIECLKALLIGVTDHEDFIEIFYKTLKKYYLLMKENSSTMEGKITFSISQWRETDYLTCIPRLFIITKEHRDYVSFGKFNKQ